MKQKISSFTIFLFGLALSFGILRGGPILFAQETPIVPPATDEPINTENQKCIEKIQPLLAQERAAFLQFINTSFQNTLANSELIDVALQRYKDYRQAVFQHFFSTAQAQPGTSELLKLTDEYGSCYRAAQREISIAEQALRKHVQGTTSAKRTTALLEKFQSLNGKLEGLNIRIGELQGYFTVMSNKVPFFIQSCLKQ